jgi:hypothetical protein
MGQGHLGQMGGAINQSSAPGALARYRVVTAFVLTACYVAVKAFAHDFWAVGFGLAVLAIILLTPEPDGVQPEPWRAHALRVVSACFVVVTLGSIWTSLT